MAFNTREISNASGAPIHLYDFYRGSTHWRYCTADRDITYDGNVYEAIPVRDNGISQDTERSNSTFNVDVPIDNELAQMFRADLPSSRVWLKVFRIHYGDTDAAAVWFGAVSQVSVESEAKATIVCQSVLALFQGNGARLTWQRGCPHMLYDGQCKVVKASYATAGTAAGVAGISLTVSAADALEDGYFSGGILEFTRNGFLESRQIRSHVGSLLVLLGRTDGLENGMSVTLYPGCPRTAEVCDERFDNIDNFGGVRHLPGKSPFSGNVIF